MVSIVDPLQCTTTCPLYIFRFRAEKNPLDDPKFKIVELSLAYLWVWCDDPLLIPGFVEKLPCISLGLCDAPCLSLGWLDDPLPISEFGGIVPCLSLGLVG